MFSLRLVTGIRDIWIAFTHHVRTLIRKKSAYDRATIEIGTRRSRSGQYERISDFEGYTFNLVNGVVVTDKLAKAGHFTERASDTYWLEKYTLPNVREGSVIEYKYTVRTPFSVGFNPRTWHFQQDIPVNWSEYRISIPDYFYYKILMSGYLPLNINQRNSTRINLLPGHEGTASGYRFAVKDAPAFRNEAYITTDDDYLSKIDFELASYTLPNQPTQKFSISWEDLDRTLLTESNFGRQYVRAGFLRETAKAINSQHSDTLKRITAAYDFVRQSIKWDETVSIASNSIKKVFDDKKGDSGDINLLLIALLREMDLDANPVILSTRAHGRINEAYALIKKFNYVVAHVLVDGKDLLLDATDAHLKPGMLPTRCLNGTGRLIAADKARFISLNPVERDAEVEVGRFTLSEDGELTGELEHLHSGYSAWGARKLFLTGGKTKFLDDFRKRRVNWQIEKAEFKGTESQDRNFTATYTFSIPEACAQASDRLYFRPMASGVHTTNPFKEAGRLYPVDFAAPIDETFSASYTLPKGFQVEEMPKPVSLSLPENGGRFVYQVSLLNDNELKVASRLSLRRAVYSAEEYAALRELFNQIVAKHAEQVVLKRSVLVEKK